MELVLSALLSGFLGGLLARRVLRERAETAQTGERKWLTTGGFLSAALTVMGAMGLGLVGTMALQGKAIPVAAPFLFIAMLVVGLLNHSQVRGASDQGA